MNKKELKDAKPVIGGTDPSYLSVVNPNGINPETGNRYCEDYDNCPEEETKEKGKGDSNLTVNSAKPKEIIAIGAVSIVVLYIGGLIFGRK